MTSKAGTRFQVTLKPAHVEKLNKLQHGTYLSTSQLFAMMIDTFYKRKFGEDKE